MSGLEFLKSLSLMLTRHYQPPPKGLIKGTPAIILLRGGDLLVTGLG